MNNKRIFIPSLVGGALLVSLMFILFFNGRGAGPGDASTQKVGSLSVVSMLTASPASSVTGTSTVLAVEPVTSTVIYQGTPVVVIDRRYILAGKSPEEIGEFVANKVVPAWLGPQGPVEVRLSRTVTREEVPQLGLGCLSDNSGSEEPPFVLVIVRGDFDLSGVPGRDPLPPGILYHSSALIIDVWAAAPTSIISSFDGSDFQEIINDPTLPEITPQPPRNCPPRTPGSYPHGAVMYGTVFPTAPRPPTPTFVIPSPISTQNP